MRRSIAILVLSILGSLIPNILLAGHVQISKVSSVSLLAMDTDKTLQAKGGGITSLFRKGSANLSIQSPKKIVKVIQPKVLEKTSTKEITKTLEDAKRLKKSTLPHMVQAWGYNRKSDRKKLANEVGITNYAGTMKQNSLIKDFLLSKVKISDRVKTVMTPDIEKTVTQVKAIQKLPLHKTVKYRGYIRQIDREKLANEVGIKKYVGTREQNLLIKKHLQKKLTIKKKLKK